MYVSSRLTNVLQGQPITTALSTTSDNIINNYNSLLTSVKVPKTRDSLNKVAQDQKIKETSLINNTEICSIPVLDSLRDRLSGLDASKLKDLTSSQLQNSDVMKAAMCTADSIFYTSPYDVGSMYHNNRIRMYIHNLRQIGSESSEGYALLADFDDSKDMFIVKVSRDPSDDTLLHELVVGLYGTNKLRQYIPNFAYVYGGFKCSPPLIDPETKKAVTWCLHDNNSVNYVLYENIAPSVPMSQYLQVCSGSDFVNVYLQILYSLRLALKLIDYTHYDLHYKNILIRDPQLGGTIQIAYETERGVEYIRTQIIPTFIDYGHSHIKVNSEHYGKNGLVPFSIYSYRSWIMHDLYKFLMFCLLGAIQNNNQSVISEAKKIFRFFNATEEPIDAINSQFPVLFSFPLTDETNTLTIDDLAAHIRLVCDTDFISSTKTSEPTLDCSKLCNTSDQVLDKIGINPNAPIPIPSTIPEFYDVTIRLQNEGRDAEKNRIIADFPYKTAMNNHIIYMKELVKMITDTRQNVKLVDIANMSLDQLFQYKTMQTIRSMYVSAASIIDTTVILKFYKDVGLATARSFDDDLNVATIEGIMKDFEDNVRSSLEQFKLLIRSTNTYLDSIKSYESVAIQRDSRLQWYWNGRHLFDVVFGLASLNPNEPITTTTVIKTITRENI